MQGEERKRVTTVGMLACSLALLAMAGGAGGEVQKYMETTLQDDAVFLHRSPAEVQRAARTVKALGADRVRLTASWSELAPSPRSKRMPRGNFDPVDSGTYREAVFRKLDTAVKAVTRAGLDVQIDLAFWAPRWAVRKASSNPRRHRAYPKAERFAQFAEAVARRYSGAFEDPTHRGSPLPAVRLWTTWNEPNHPSFLSPQWVRDKHGWRAMSPHVYRAMHNAAFAAIKRVTDANKVLVGATASTGSAVPGKGGVPPLEFARAMACVDRQLRPLRVPECRRYEPVRADGWSHHPYSRYTLPGDSAKNPDDAPIADTGRLGELLRELRKLGRLAQDLPIFQTEYGYETRQDDPFHAPFTREEQAAFIGWSTYLAWQDPDTKMMAQFLLRDIDPAESGRRKNDRSYYRDWQSGLYAADGSEKPAVQAFKLPFWAQVDGEGDRRAIKLFGQVRPGDGPQVVQVERRDDRSGIFVAVPTFGTSCDGRGPTFLTDASGFFLRAAPYVGPGTYRLSWQRPDGAWESGFPIALHEPGPAAR